MSGRAARIAAFALLLGASLALLLFLPVRDLLARFLKWAEDLGPAAPWAIGAAYVPAAVMFVPGSILTLGAGFLLGLGVGAAAVSLGSTAGACAAFWVGRTLARGWIESRMETRPNWRAIDEAVARRGFRIVLLTRLSPIFPFNLLNYAYGVTRVRFRDFALGSWVGMLPGTVMYVYLGTSARGLAELAAGEGGASPMEMSLLVAGLVVTVATTLYVMRIARRALRAVVDR